MTGRLPAVLAAGALLLALLTGIAVLTPWSPLGGAPRLPVHVEADFTAAEAARADAYRGAVRLAAYAGLAASTAAALLLGLTPLGARVVGVVVQATGERWWAGAAGGAVLVAAVVRLAAVPFDARVEQLRRDYGLSTRSWGLWVLDLARGWLLSTALLVAALLAVLALLRWWPTWWWAAGAALAAALVVGGSFAYPLVVEPVFNDFRPMREEPLRGQLLELAERDGLRVNDVLVADASRRTTSLNAYVSGFGATRRIVVYDTLLREASPAEVRSVVAHELGHAESRDVAKGTALGALGAAAAVCLLAAVLPAGAVLRRAGVPALSDPRSVALLVAAVTVVSTLAGPASALVSRRVEARADVHALELTGDPVTFARMQRRLALANLSDLTPPRLAHLLFATHPSAPERLALARSWARAEGVPEPPPLAP